MEGLAQSMLFYRVRILCTPKRHLGMTGRPYKWVTTVVDIIQDPAFKFINA